MGPRPRRRGGVGRRPQDIDCESQRWHLRHLGSSLPVKELGRNGRVDIARDPGAKLESPKRPPSKRTLQREQWGALMKIMIFQANRRSARGML